MYIVLTDFISSLPVLVNVESDAVFINVHASNVAYVETSINDNACCFQAGNDCRDDREYVVGVSIAGKYPSFYFRESLLDIANKISNAGIQVAGINNLGKDIIEEV